MITTESLERYGGLAFLTYTYPRYRRMLMAATHNGPVSAIGGFVDGKAAGLALAIDDPEGTRTEVCSLYVAPEFRRRGLGRELLVHLERDLRARGISRVSMAYLSGPNTSAPLGRILDELAWAPPEPERILCRCDGRMLTADWMSRPPKIPEGAEIFPWSELRDEEREALVASQATDPWIHPMVDPFKGDGTFAFNSVGMRHRGAVVGWVVTDRFDDESLMYSCSYMRPDLQHRGYIVALYVEAIRRHAERLAEFPKALWAVPCVFPRMVRFARRWLGPYATSIEEYMLTSKPLAVSPES
jgi:GNAT superfamily N-acetyltransferase